MSDSLAYLDSRREQMVELLTRLGNINSYSYNIAGLAAVAKVLGSEFAALSPDLVDIVSLAPAEALGERGETRRRDLGDLLSFAKRPDAPVQALLVIHYDTVYSPENSFQA